MKAVIAACKFLWPQSTKRTSQGWSKERDSDSWIVHLGLAGTDRLVRHLRV